MGKLVIIAWSLAGLLLGALLMTAAADSAAPANGPIITETYRGGPLTAKVGEKITLNLRDPASGGYSIVTPVFDARVLKLLATEKLPPERQTVPRMGDFGRIVYKFEALTPGETDLAINIARPWEAKKPPEEYLKVKIKVLP